LVQFKSFLSSLNYSSRFNLQIAVFVPSSI
jgi:hypothetical protein